MFKLTPAIKWLEDNIETNEEFDNVYAREMFDIQEDHQCAYDKHPDYCYWLAADEKDSWDFDSMNLDAQAEINWAYSTIPDEEFLRLLNKTERSPFYKAIAE